MEQTEQAKELIANCDAIVFGSYKEEANVHTVMTFLKASNKRKPEPTEMGHKFNITLFKHLSPKEEDVELFRAVLGDPRGYVERMGKFGYNGLVVKHQAWKKVEIQNVIHAVLSKYGFEDKLIKKVVKTTVT